MKTTPEVTLAEWVERDLTAAVEEDAIAPAFEVEPVLAQIADVIASGKFPVVVGESGVGKSSIVNELVRRIAPRAWLPELSGRRVLQISFRARASSLRQANQLRPEMQRLVEALLPLHGEVIPYFRDLHYAHVYDLEPQLELLGLKFKGVLLGEARSGTFEAMLEGTPALDEFYVGLRVVEPDLPTMTRLLARWSERQAAQGRRFEPKALQVGLELAHRFLARSRMPRKAVDLMAQVGALTSNARPISAAEVIDRFHTMFQVPRLLVDPEVPFDPNEAERDFNRRVLEQPEAVQAVTHMISMIKAGLSDSRRPFGVFLFVGPTGVGKTHIAQMLAELLLGSADRVVRLNMADYPNDDDALVLFGNPSGFSPSVKRGVLTQRLMGQPFSVLLLDEFEKAHRAVHDRFLQLFDEGSFVNGDGESISCRSSIVIATSNAGAEIYRRRAVGFSDTPTLDELDRELDRRLPEHFRFELLNRFDRIVHFHPLSRRGIRSIARRELDLIKARSGLTSRGVTVRVGEAVIDWIAANGYDPFNGARFLRRTIERHVTTALADALVRDHLREGAEIDITVRAGRVVARTVEDPAPSEPVEVALAQGPGERTLKLDRAALEVEARRLVELAKPRLAELDEKRELATRLLETMAAPGFWDDRAASMRALDDHRRLDVAIQGESRLARPIGLLAEVLGEIDARRSVAPGRLGPLLVDASEALRSWDLRRAEQGPGASWVIVRSLDPTRNAAEEMARLVTIERAWAGRLHLAVGLAAFGFENEQLARAIVEVEGPGSLAYFEMERGVHRFVRTNRDDLRLRVDVVPKGQGSGADTRVRLLRERVSALELEATWSVAIEHPETGRLVDLYGADRDVLSAILRDVGPSLIDEPSDRRVVRVYARDGVGARDARTGASVGRFKDVLAGRLDVLHDAWRRAQEPAS